MKSHFAPKWSHILEHEDERVRAIAEAVARHEIAHKYYPFAHPEAYFRLSRSGEHPFEDDIPQILFDEPPFYELFDRSNRTVVVRGALETVVEALVRRLERLEAADSFER